jgi:O-antigen/teichoic acid export membrane protein
MRRSVTSTRARRFDALTNTASVSSDLRNKSVRAAAYTWTAGVGDFVLRFGSTAILARLVLPEHFGLIMMVSAVTSIADQFRDLGLSTVTVQRSDISHEETSNLFWINVAAGLLIALVVCAASPLVASYYKEPRVIVPLCILATTFVWGGLMVQHQALLTRQLKLGYTSTIRLLSSLVSTILAVVLAWQGYGYWALVWREVARSVILTIGMWMALPWVPSLPNRNTSVRSLLAFGANLSAANIVGTFGNGVDRLLLGRFSGAIPTAIYRQAYQLLVLPTEQLLSPVYQVAQPGLSLLQTEPAQFRKFYRKVLTLACIATMPLSLFVAVNAAEVTRVILGRKWLASAPLLMVLSLSAFIKQPVSSTAFILIAQGRSRMYLHLTLLHHGCAIVLMCIGIRWGAIGIAYAEVATTYLLIAPRLYYTFKDSPMTMGAFLSAIACPFTASLVMALGLMFLRQFLPATGAPALLSIAAATGFIIFVGVWVLLPGGRNQLFELFSDLRFALERKPARVNSVSVPGATARL